MRCARGPVGVGVALAALSLGCDAATGEPGAAGGQPGYRVTRQSLGAIQVDGTTAASVSFTLPDDAVSFTLVADLPDAVQAVVPVKVTSPEGVVYDYDDPSVTAFKTVGLSNAPYAALFPNTPRLPLLAGTYSFALAATEATTLQVDVLFKRGSGDLSAGSLPLVFFFPAGAALDAAKARTDPALQQAIATLQATYARVGVTAVVADDSYLDLPGSDAYATIDDRAELRGLYALSGASGHDGLAYFLVDQFVFAGGQGLLGVAGGIPGSPGLEGTAHAGVSVAYGLLQDDPVALGLVMAHEGGHYLGLAHTTEPSGEVFDTLDDTPECPAASYDLDGSGKVDASECRDHGADNLMFWQTDGSTDRTLSADQRFVLLRSPLVSVGPRSPDAAPASQPHSLARPEASPPSPLSSRWRGGGESQKLQASMLSALPSPRSWRGARGEASVLPLLNGIEHAPSREEFARAGSDDEVVAALDAISRDPSARLRHRAGAAAALGLFARADARAALARLLADPATGELIRRPARRAYAAASGADAARAGAR